MSLVVPIESKEDILAAVLGQKLRLRLYKNDKEPSLQDSANSYREASFDGYEPITLNESGWQRDVLMGTYSRQVFSSTKHQEPEKIYGYYVTDEKGRLKWAERFDETPWVMSNKGDQIGIVPRFAV